MLDTNVLMHDPASLFRFEEHDLYLPMGTLEELDSNKKGLSDVARNARQASRFLDEIVSGDRAATSRPACRSGREGRPGGRSGRLFLQTEAINGDLPATLACGQDRQPDPRRWCATCRRRSRSAA